MEASVEARFESVEERLRVVEGLLGVGQPRVAPASPRPFPPAPPAPASAQRRERPDLEELLGGRVLGWVGGVAVVLATVFLVTLGIRNGWIDEPVRVALAFLASASLTGAGLWLYERRGRTQAARAAVAAGIAAFYASNTAATALYHLLAPALGLVVAGGIGAGALVLAIRWSSTEIAGLGVVGALLSPVLVDAGTSTASFAFMTIALVVAVWILVWRRWRLLALAAYVVSVPQVALWLDREHHLALTLPVVVAFWALYAMAALGYELRDATAQLRLDSVGLLFSNGALATLAGWWLLHDAGHGHWAAVWVFGSGAVHVALGAAAMRSRIGRDLSLLLVVDGAALTAVAFALAVHGPALVAAWAAQAVVLAWAGRRLHDPRGARVGIVFLAAAAAHTVAFEAPPNGLAYGLASMTDAVLALLVVIAAALALRERAPAVGAAIAALYLGSLAIVDGVGGHSTSVQQNAQLALSALWALLGLGGLVLGLVRDVRVLRISGFGLLALAVGKVFVVDLAALGSLWRVASFFVLGLLLLAGAFAYQRLRRHPGTMTG